MSRKLVWFYNLLLLGFFAGVLIAINPALAAAPIAFSAMFLGALFIIQFIDWALSKVVSAHKLVVGVPAVIGLFFLFTGLATVAWGLFAVLLTVGSFAAQRPRKVKPASVALPDKIEPGDIPAAARRVA